MDDTRSLVTILSSLGAGGVLLVLAQTFAKWVTGASARERTRNTDMKVQLSEALTDRDKEYDRAERAARNRRRAEDALAEARRKLIEAGLPPGEWPKYEQEPESNKEKKK